MKRLIVVILIGGSVSFFLPGFNLFGKPQFFVAWQQLEETLSDLPGEIREGILAEPEYFLTLVSCLLDDPEELLWLVDKKHPLPADYSPHDLVELTNYPVSASKNSLQLRYLAVVPLLDMIKAARAEGADPVASSCYRSYTRQKWLFDYWVGELGEAEAEITSARAGTSQHQLGTVIDFHPISKEFEEMPEWQWLKEHAWEYGFSLSYPEGYTALTGYTFESWHWRYIGKSAAEMTEKFFGGIQQYFLEYWAAYRSVFLTP